VDEPKSPACVRPDDTLAAAKKLMDAGRFRRLPVIESDKLIGIITERDLRQRWGYLDSTKVNAAMLRASYTSPGVLDSRHLATLFPFDTNPRNDLRPARAQNRDYYWHVRCV
jgi:CBS domain-containing protein